MCARACVPPLSSCLHIPPLELGEGGLLVPNLPGDNGPGVDVDLLVVAAGLDDFGRQPPRIVHHSRACAVTARSARTNIHLQANTSNGTHIHAIRRSLK